MKENKTKRDSRFKGDPQDRDHNGGPSRGTSIIEDRCCGTRAIKEATKVRNKFVQRWPSCARGQMLDMGEISAPQPLCRDALVNFVLCLVILAGVFRCPGSTLRRLPPTTEVI